MRDYSPKKLPDLALSDTTSVTSALLVESTNSPASQASSLFKDCKSVSETSTNLLPMLVLTEADNSSALKTSKTKNEDDGLKTPEPAKAMTAKIVSQDKDSIVFSDNGPIVKLDSTSQANKIKPESIRYRNDCHCNIIYDGNQLNKLELKDPTGKVVLQVIRDEKTKQLNLSVNTSPTIGLFQTTLKAAPLLGKDGVFTLHSDGKTKVQIDASGNLLLASALDEKNDRLVITQPGKQEDLFINDRLVQRSFLDAANQKSIFLERDENKPDEITSVLYVNGKSVVQFSRKDDAWLMIPMTDGAKPLQGTLKLNDRMLPEFKTKDGINLSDATFNKDSNNLTNFLNFQNQDNFKRVLTSVYEVHLEKQFYAGKGKNFHNLPEKEQKALLEDFSKSSQKMLLEFSKGLQRDEEYLKKTLADLKSAKRDQSDLTPAEFKNIWNEMSTTKKAFGLVVDWMQTSEIPDAINTLEYWKLPIPPGCPLLSPKDAHGDNVSIAGLKDALKKNCKLNIDADTFPNPETLKKLMKVHSWCSEISVSQHKLQVQHDLKTVYPNAIKQLGLPEKWLTEPGLSDEARRNALAYMVPLCETLKEYGTAMFLAKSKDWDHKENPLPPGVSIVTDGNEKRLVIKFPDSICPSDEKTAAFLDQFKRWKETTGAKFDAEQERLAEAFSDVTKQAYFGDIPLKGYVTFENDGPKKGQLKELLSEPSKDSLEFNLLSGDFDVEEVPGGYKLITKWQAKKSEIYNYLDIGAEEIGGKRVTESTVLPPGSKVVVINHGKPRVVDIENAKEMKAWQQVYYYGEKGLTAAVELSMCTGFPAAMLLRYAGKQATRTIVSNIARGTLGASGFLMNNADVMTRSWGPKAHQVRSLLILTDVSHGLYRSFVPSSTLGAQKALAYTNIASGEMRFHRELILRANKFNDNNKVWHGWNLATETAFIGVLGKDFYQKYGKAKQAPFKPSDVNKDTKSLDGANFSESVLGKSIRPNEETRRQLALVEQVFSNFTGLPLHGIDTKNDGADKTPKLSPLFEVFARKIESRLEKITITQDYLNTISGTKLKPAEKSSIESIQRKLNEILLPKPPVAEDEGEKQKWIVEQDKKKGQFIEDMRSLLEKDPTATAAQRFAAMLALYALSNDQSESSNNPGHNQIHRTFSFDVQSVKSLKIDPTSIINQCAVQGSPEMRLIAVEMQLRLDIKDRGALHAAATTRNIVKDNSANESTKIKALDDLTRLIHGISAFETDKDGFKALTGDQRVDYLAASFGLAPIDLRQFLTEVAGNKEENKNVRIMAAQCLTILGSTKGEALDKELQRLVTSYQANPNDFFNAKLKDLKTLSETSTDIVDKMAATSTLIQLGEIGGLANADVRSKTLMDIIETTTTKIRGGKDLTTDDFITAAEAIALLNKDDIKALGADKKQKLVDVLNLNERLPGVDTIKLQVLNKLPLLVEEWNRKEVETAVLKLIAPNGTVNGALPSQSPSDLVRIEAIKSLVNCNLVSEPSIAVLKLIASPGVDEKTLPLESNAAVRLQALNALVRLDNYSFRQVASKINDTETDPAIRILSESYRLGQSFPIRDTEYKEDVANYQDLLRRALMASVEEFGQKTLSSIGQTFKTLEPTVVVETLVPVKVKLSGMTKMGETQYGERMEKQKVTIDNPARMKLLDDQLFNKVNSKDPAEREAAEQGLILLITQLSGNQVVDWIPNNYRSLIEHKATQTFLNQLNVQGDNVVSSKTLERAKHLINDASTKPWFRLQLLNSLDKIVERASAKDPQIGIEHANYLAVLLRFELLQVPTTPNERLARIPLQRAILDQMEKYKTKDTYKSLEIFAGACQAENPNKKIAQDMLYRMRDGVAPRYESAKPSNLTDKTLLADRMLKSFQSAAGCQDIVDTIFSCSKGMALKEGDPRLNSVRLALAAKGVNIEFDATQFNVQGLESKLKPRKATMNGAEMIRLAAATVVLQPDNSGFNDKDRLEAFIQCARLMVEGKEEGYRKDAKVLLETGIKNGDEMSLAALCQILLDAQRDGTKSETVDIVRQFLNAVLDDGKVELSTPNGEKLLLTKSDSASLTINGANVKIIETRDGRLQRASIEYKKTDPAKKTFTDTIVDETAFGTGERSEKIAFAKLLLKGDATDYVSPTDQQKKVTIEALGRMVQADDRFGGAKVEDRLECAKLLCDFLYPNGDFRTLTDSNLFSPRELSQMEETLITSLSDLAVDGNAEAKTMLMSLAGTQRERVLQCMLSALPYSKRIPMEQNDNNAKQIQYHWDCYQLNPSDLNYGIQYIQKGSVPKRDAGVMPPLDTTVIEKSFALLPRDRTGGVRANAEVYRDFFATVQSKPSNLQDVADKMLAPYRELDPKQMKVWTDLILEAGEQGKNALTSNEYAIMAGAYFQAAPVLGSGSATMQRFPIDDIIARLGESDGSTLKFSLGEAAGLNLQSRTSCADTLKQAGTKASKSNDEALKENYRKLQLALEGPVKTAKLENYLAKFGKSLSPSGKIDNDAVSKEICQQLLNGIKQRPIEDIFKNGGDASLMSVGNMMIECQMRYAAISQFLEIAPPEVQVSLAKGLLQSGSASVEELGFRAAAKVLRFGSPEHQREVNDFLKKMFSNSTSVPKTRKTNFKTAFENVARDKGNSSSLFESWRKESDNQGLDAELQSLFADLDPKTAREFVNKTLTEKGILPKDKVRLAITYAESIKKDSKRFEGFVDDVLAVVRSESLQIELLQGIHSAIGSERELLSITLKRLEDKNVHPKIQDELKDRIKQLEK